MRADLNQNILGGMNINLQVASLVQGAVKKSHQSLVHNIWADILRIALHFSQQWHMFVAVKQLVSLIQVIDAWPSKSFGHRLFVFNVAQLITRPPF